MKKLFFITVKIFCVFLTGCASRGLPELPDTWQPANKFDETPRVLALFRPYSYQVLSVDRTLMQLTRRWARDTQIDFDYRCDDDFSLPITLEGKKYREIDVAIQAVNEVYESFGVTFALSAKNKFTTTCANRDVVTGITRLRRSDKLDLNSKIDKTIRLQTPPKAIE